MENYVCSDCGMEVENIKCGKCGAELEHKVLARPRLEYQGK